MPSPATLTAFLLAVLAMQLVPGPDTMLVVSRGVGEGRRVALWTVLGMTAVAGAIQLPLLALGVGSFVAASPFAFDMLRLAGAGYLVWLGIRLLLARHVSERHAADALPPGAAMRQGLIANLTNPNPMIFMLAFLPQFVDPSRGSVTMQLLVLGALQKATGFAMLALAAVAAGTLGAWISRRRRLIVWQQRIAGTALIALGASLVVRGR